MQVKELIVTPVTSCTIATHVAEARDLMKRKNISALPVVKITDGNPEIEGIVSYHDLAGVYDDNVSVQQVMSRKIYAVTPETTVQIAAKEMIENKIHHLVVMDQDKIVGIISSFDFVKLVSDSNL